MFSTDESVKRSGRGKRGGALPAKRPPRQSPPQGDEGLLSDLRRSQTRAAAGRVGRYDRRMPFAVRILIAWAIDAAALAVAAWIFSGITVGGAFGTLILAALVYGLLASLVKPV